MATAVLKRDYMVLTFSWLIWSLKVYSWLIVLRILFSWLQPFRYQTLVRLWFSLTDPGLYLLNLLVPPMYLGGWYCPDLSILLLLLIFFVIELLFYMCRE